MPKSKEALNPPTANVLVQGMAKIVERRTKTKANLEKAKKDLEAMVKKSKLGICSLVIEFIS